MKSGLFRYFTLVACISFIVPASAAPASAQAWDTPSFFSPRPGEDLGAYAFQAKDSKWGYEGIWRQEGNLNLGVRLGVTGAEDFFVGSEFYKPLSLMGPGSSLQMSGVLGFGATFGDVTALRIPLGVSVGAQLGTGSLRILPYVHPRVAFDLFAADVNGTEQTETEFNFDVDVGADIGLGSQFVGRVGATVTNLTTVGFGIAYRMPRRIAVR